MGIWRGYLLAVRWSSAVTALLRPGHNLMAVIDDAAAMTVPGRPFFSPAQVVESTRLDAQELGCLFDREKGIVGVIAHGELLACRCSSVSQDSRAGE